LYNLLVRATSDHGETIQIENGSVGGRLHLLTIPAEGPIEKVVIDPEQYLE